MSENTILNPYEQFVYEVPHALRNTIQVNINTEDYPELFTQLTKSAKKHMRTIEFQALKYIAEGLEREGFIVTPTKHQEGVSGTDSSPMTWP